MSFLSTKSDLSLLSAETLVKAGLYNSSIHCAYYACFQMVKHYLITKGGYTEESLDNECRYKKISGGSHVCYTSLVYEHFIAKKLRMEAVEFRNEIKELRSTREKADYFNTQPMSVDDSKKALEKAKTIIKLLKKL
jgi:uncharacterized protein (UPF0332 family)